MVPKALAGDKNIKRTLSYGMSQRIGFLNSVEMLGLHLERLVNSICIYLIKHRLT